MQSFFKMPDAFKMPDLPELAGTNMAKMLRAMGIDVSQVVGFIQQIHAEMVSVNARIERIEAKQDQILAGLEAMEEVTRATSPEARNIIDGASLHVHPETQAELAAKGMLDPALYAGGAIPPGTKVAKSEAQTEDNHFGSMGL